jgi:medium-chain acyl-[acyl-carrier-protein] hydrolase
MKWDSGERWLVRRLQGRAQARLFCFPYAGAGASVYRSWAAGLPAGIELCILQLPGRENRLREPPLTRIDALVEAIVPALLPHLDLPYALFGHSMGAVIASEVVAALQDRGAAAPAHLFVSARRAPHLPDPDAPISGLRDSEFVAELQRRYNGIPAEVLRDREMMQLLLPTLRADMQALETYRPSGSMRIECPLSVFGGSRDPRTPRAHLEAWREVARGELRLRLFEGDHFYLAPRRVEVLAEVAAALSQCPDGTRAAASGCAEATP